MSASDAGDDRPASTPGAVRRRDLLVGGAAAAAAVGAGALGALGVERAVGEGPNARPDSADAPAPTGADWEQRGSASASGFAAERAARDGAHQPGIATPPQAHAVFLTLDLAPTVDAARVRNLLRILTDDIARLAEGRAPIADQEPELAERPANLTVTVGFGRGLVDRVAPEVRPTWLDPLPAFPIDRLEDRWSGGDLLLQVCADDPITLAHAQRMLLKDLRAFTTLRSAQLGFRTARGADPRGTTTRNLFGQVDGTVNPRPDEASFAETVWISAGASPKWLMGGTSLVLRRIRMDLETWDEVDRPGREASVGRRLDTGAPLTGQHERDEPDFEAKTPEGFSVISPVSHVRRARGAERILRRVYNYDAAVPGASGPGAAVNDAGLIFASYQADPVAQFLPIQRRLAEADLLNTWTTPIGSAVFAIPPMPSPGGFIGEGLFVHWSA